MKKPKTKAAPTETPAAKPAETPLTNSWQASVQQGATPGIFPIMWNDGFTVGHGTCQKFKQWLRVRKPDQPLEHEGKKFFWVCEIIDHRGTTERIEQKWCETEENAEYLFRKKLEEMKALAGKIVASDARKPSSDERDLQEARLKVMREQYPDTFKAMDKLETVPPGARPEAVESLFRAYAVDLVRLHKPANLGDVLPFKSLPTDTNFIMELARAYRAQSPHDPVDVEIAAQWHAAGYNKMSLAGYTAAINAKAGARLSPDAMKARRLKKFRLLSSNPEGAPIKSS